MKRIFLLVIISFGMACAVFAQRQVSSIRKDVPPSHAEQIVSAYTDSLEALKQRFASWRYTAPDTLANPYYFPIFAASVYQPSAVGSAFGVRPYAKGYELLAAVYAAHPSLVSGFMGNDEKKERKPSEEKKADPVDTKNIRKNDTPRVEIKAPEDEQLELVVRRPNFWTFNKELSLLFMQTHISDNWYKGGNSSMSMQVSTMLDANYNNKQKVKFENKLEMRIGFMTEKGDELHKFKTNNDLLRMTNRFGLQAAQNLYYTLMLQSWTQFYPGYHSNDAFVYSDFMSPFESLLTIGMEYKLSKKNFSISATVSPLALNFKYVDREALITRFGLPAGQHSDWYFGSNLTLDTTWKIWKNLSWKSHLYYFTNYKKVQAEWEHTFNLLINKYLTTELFLHPRFDDSVNRNSDNPFFQFKENFSLKLNVKF